MKRTAAILALFLVLGLGGCEHAPPRESDESAQFNFRTARTPYAAAICIARNAKSLSGDITAEERTLGKTSWEVVVRSGGETLSVVEIRNDGVGSTVSIRVTTRVGSDRAGFAKRLVVDCQATMTAAVI